VELLRTIAFLCAASSGADTAIKIEKIQLECQQYYVKCLSNTSTYKDITRCIKDRKLK
jgi:hypothetical protein